MYTHKCINIYIYKYIQLYISTTYTHFHCFDWEALRNHGSLESQCLFPTIRGAALLFKGLKNQQLAHLARSQSAERYPETNPKRTARTTGSVPTT